MGIKSRVESIRKSYGALRALGRDPTSLMFDRMDSPTQAMMGNQPVLLFGTNNYLGLTFDEACVEATVKAAREFGVGTTGSRIANGTYDGHRALEAEIAAFYNKRQAMLYSTGFLANLGVIAALAEKGDYLLIDADSHASIYDAAKMADAETIRFRHNSPEDLAKRLARLKGLPGDKLVVVEGIYSMLGDTGPLKEFAAVKREAGDDVYMLVDEAHSLGVMGEHGRGLCEHDGVEADCDYIVGTFSKSVGTTGGYCVSDVEGFEVLRSYSRPYMFTASMTPPAVATARAAFKRMAEAPELRHKLWRNATRLYEGLARLGFDLGPEISPVVAVKLPGPQEAVMLWNALIDSGVYTNVAIPPATPNALSLLRVSVSAAHDDRQIDQALEIFAAAGARLGLTGKGRAA
ncbi:MAG TPA: aminotransferase class I/II-fold pyridoxal phosphate-dependent enzyme [Thermohalobaculum sp.]|nr:aminotransferase class I/II-fold pyridoxal phosphate-dependent enzyme [Thermohalobaculum sp.]